MSDSLSASISRLFGDALTALDPDPLRRAAGAIEQIRPAVLGLPPELARAASMGAILVALQPSVQGVSASPPSPPPVASAPEAPQPAQPVRRGRQPKAPKKPKKRRRRMPARYKEDGTLGPDWVDDDPEIGPVWSQKGVMDRLNLPRPSVLLAEERGKLPRVFSRGKVAYRCCDVEAFAAWFEEKSAEQAAGQASTLTPTTTSEPTPPDRA